MKLNAYTIYDRKGLNYHVPFFALTDGAALRSFSDLANDLQTNVGRHPADYVLYLCGVYEDDSAVLIGNAPVHVADALSLVRSPVGGDLFPLEREKLNGKGAL